MNAAKRRSRGKKLATLLGVTCLALVAIPATASAAIVGHYAPDDTSGVLELELLSNGEGDAIALGCSPGGNATLNGAVFNLGAGPIPCNGPEQIQIYGGGGNDTVDFSGVSKATGFTSILGGCEDRACQDLVTVEGDSGNDTLIGGPFSERFNGEGAFEFGTDADTIRGNGGQDQIKGTQEADKLFGGAERDIFEPGPGNDVIRAGGGNDYFEEFWYHKDRDSFFGEGGHDEAHAGAGGDLLDGGPGGDYMEGMRGKDRMFGRAGKDYLAGNQARDRLRGGPGRDTVIQGGTSVYDNG